MLRQYFRFTSGDGGHLRLTRPMGCRGWVEDGTSSGGVGFGVDVVDVADAMVHAAVDDPRLNGGP